FTNTYHVDPTTAEFPVTKEVVVPEGFAGPDDWEFTVNVAGTPAAQTMTGKVTKAEPTVTFGDFTYTAPGEYTYTVTETGTVAGITNDEAATTGKTVTVNVVDNGDGTLTATPSSTAAEPLKFTNTYNTEPIKAKIPVEKILSVAEGLNAPDITGEFTFTLTSAEGTPMPETTSYTNPDADGGDMTFGDITFDKPGTYTYTVKETGEVAGVSAVGATEKTVEISVVDNKDGTMTATVNGGQKLQFTNEYKVGEATAEIPVNKILEVAEGLTPDSIEGKFTFTLTAADGTPMPETTSFTNPDATGGKVTFGGEDDPITFTKPGTYTYTVTETGSADGVENDKTASKTVKVVVTDNGDGTMTAVVNEGKELDFTNTYTVEPTKASFPVEKVLEVPEGLNPDSIKNKFTFTLTAEDGTPMPETKSYTNPDADGGTVTFGEIEYTEPGTYTYTVTETGEVDGITNDTEGSKTVTVTVVDNGDGTLTATPSSTKEKPLQFTNKYEVEPTTAKFPVKKVLKVPEGLTPNSIAQKFTFTVTAEDGTPMPPVVALQNPDATGGTVTFGDIEYTVPGTYTYTVTESGSADGVTNDETLAKTVIVTVTDNGDGTLTAVASSTDEKPLTFTNKYSVEPTTAKFPVQKIMEVPEYLDGPESWSYTINVEAQKGAPAADTMTGTVTDKADTVTFGDFTYKEPGTYTYVVTENGTYKGVTNDEAAASGKTVTVTVVDNGDGTLTATPDYTTDKPLQFTNKYDAPPVEVPTSAYLKKTVVQMPPKTDETEFKFTLQSTEEGAEPLEGTVKATKAGDYTIDFGKLTFDKPGTYTYTLTEVLDDLDGGWVVTGSPATVTIKVTDNKEGELVAEVTGATISNNFETVKVEGEKIWNDDEYFDENGEPIEGYERPDVTINLLADGKEIDEVVVTAEDNWKFSFVDLPKHKDHGTEIVYTITEDDVEAYEGEVVDYTVENTPQRLEEDQLNPTELTIKKVDAETGNVIPTGATFVLKQGDTEIEYTTGEDGTVVIPFEQGGNENGEYTLYEKESPEGYELTDKTYTIVVDKEFDHVEIKESLWTWFYNLIFNKDTKTLFDEDTQTLTVENPPVKTNIEAEKVWNDNDDKDGVRPDSITLTLTGTAGGEEVYRDVKTVTEGDDWKAEWNDLATYVDGNEVTFEMTEAKVKGYDTDDIVLEKGEDGNYSVIVKNNHQSEPKKEVFTGSSKQSVDGEMVEAGQELTYEITYVNTTGKTVEEVTITDKIPENTEFVEADNEGVFKNGKVTWKIYDVTDGEEVVVTVVVKVKDSANGQALKNKAVVNDGTNKYESNEVVNKTPVKHDPPVKKIVKGDTPKKADKFKFALTQVSTTADVKMPMPEGAKGKTAYVEVKAGQKKEFGEIVFTEPGTYVYKVKEVNTKIKNYKYDSSEYTLTYVLEDNDGDLEMTLTVTKNGKKYDHSVFKFTNIYDEPVKTGDTTQVLPYMLMFTAALLGLILVFRRRKAVRK
ncbi:MAG: Cna B-type domain-containing protein, partial [Clostridiales bacterium]|nr:Cna B-type domain-containing protein [Clostridiales bacterium]